MGEELSFTIDLIMMGTLRIALGSGASAELRQPLGVAVVGGLLVSQPLTLLVTPVIYLYMEKLAEGVKRLFSPRVEAVRPATR
ncbi:Cu/Ag efflux pump CusA (plasmid) [Ensifer sp. WSM1721]